MLYTGVIEDRNDPLKLGRCKVRVVGLHTHDAARLPSADLPWAIPMQPITSAALSGIGTSPLGLVEGTWVVVMFQDEHKQFPIIIGSIGGIPQSGAHNVGIDENTLKIKIDGELQETTTQSNVLLDGSGQPVTTSDGKPVTTGTVATTPTIVENTNKLKRAAEYQPSQNCITLLHQFEGLRLNAYPDPATGAKPITIGYGTTRINNQEIQMGTTITKAQADEYFLSDLKTKFSPAVARAVRAPITQSMYDALVSFVYNLGPGTLDKSTLLKDLNSAKYLDAAAEFLVYDKAMVKGVLQSMPGLTRRRKAEKDLFLKDGIPNIAGELPEQRKQEDAQAQKPTESNNAEKSTQSSSSTVGFGDPNNKYPLYVNEPDTNRLARHEEIQKTVVYKKETAIVTGIEIAGGGTWNQSPIPYNAQYPFNHVMQSESGHIMEFDDTPNSERVHLYHKSGTFTEIDANGTQVNRIVGDNYEILERNGFVQVHGSLNVTVDGANKVLVKNAFNLDVRGVANINVFNDANLNISGSLNASVTDSFKLKASSIIIEGDTVDIKSNGAFKASASGSFDINAGGALNADGSNVNIGNGAANAAASGLSAPIAKQSPEMPEISTLRVIKRGPGGTPVYETPEEADANPAGVAKEQQKHITSGALKKEEIDSGEKKEAQTAPLNTTSPPGASCDAIMLKQTFEPSFQLSKNFTLGALTKNGTRPPIPQNGFTAQGIVCNLKGLCENCLEPVYNLYPNLIITSGFRRPQDTPGISSTGSQHNSGQAVDIVLKGDRKYHYEAIQKIQALIPFDQLILEYLGGGMNGTVWIHISFTYSKGRKMVFTMRDHKVVSAIGQFTLIA